MDDTAWRVLENERSRSRKSYLSGRAKMKDVPAAKPEKKTMAPWNEPADFQLYICESVRKLIGWPA